MCVFSRQAKNVANPLAAMTDIAIIAVLPWHQF
jgi:hypothetical protein